MRVLILSLSLISVSVAASTPRIQTRPDIIYGKGQDQALRLDLFHPQTGAGPFPAVVFIHGGGWQGGNRKFHVLTQLAPHLAANGYVAVNISYRLAPAYKFPAQLEDSKCAIRWLRANSKTYNINPQRIGAAGISAGGHLVSLLGVTHGLKELEGTGGHADHSSDVQAVVAFCPPTDLLADDWSPRVQQIFFNLIGAAPKDELEMYRKASPLTHVQNGKTFPPFLFFHGTKDESVPHNQSVKLHEALQAAGASSELVLLEGQPHVFGGETIDMSIQRTLEFFDRHLKK